MGKNEKAIILAFKAGYTRTADIIEQTGLSQSTVNTAINLLRLEYAAQDLAAILAPKPPEPPLKYISHDCVIIDATLAPGLAAELLNQVLGDEYCNDLKIAL